MATPPGLSPLPSAAAHIALKRSAVLGRLAIYLLFACGAVWIGSNTYDAPLRPEAAEQLSRNLVLALCLLYATIATALLVRQGSQLVRGTPGLTIDERGIDGHSMAYSGGFVPWSNISSVAIQTDRQGKRRVFVYLVDEEMYLATRGPLQRWTQRLGRSPVSLASEFLDVDTGYLVATLTQLLAAHRLAPPRP